MKKRVFMLGFTLLMLSFLISFCYAQEQEVEKAYSWLTSQLWNLQKWQELNTKQNVFALLALKCNKTYVDLGNVSLHNKAFITSNFMCLGKEMANSEMECKVVESSLAKIAFDEINTKSGKISNWLLNQSTIFKDIIWLLEVDVARGKNASCVILYDSSIAWFSINESKALYNLTNNECFELYPASLPYWLRIKKECYGKNFKIKCVVSDGSEYRVTLHYKKNLEDENWYTSRESRQASSAEWIEFFVGAYCLKNPNQEECDYEGTLIATYALRNEADINRFIPYLVIEKENNEKYLPEAFLCLLGIERYCNELEQLQSQQGFWLAQNSVYGQFYDTALAGLTKKGNLEYENLGAKYYLLTTTNFKEVNSYRYWLCSEAGCDKLRDTAFLLYSFWPNRCPGIALAINVTNCEEAGIDYSCKASCDVNEIEVPNLRCPSGMVCCKLVSALTSCEAAGGTCKFICDEDEFRIENASCENVMYECCKPYSEATSCSEFNGEECSENETCLGETVTIANGIVCCKGSCSSANVSQQTCQEAGGNICNTDQVCINPSTRSIVGFFTTQDTERCCLGLCVKNNYCSEIGEECESDRCDGTIVATIDTDNCCVGTCLKSCSELNGIICEPPKVCKVSYLEESYESYCCPIGQCVEKKSKAWVFILLLIIALAGFFIYFFKLRKPKTKPKPFSPPPTLRRPLVITGKPLSPLKPVKPMKPLKPLKPLTSESFSSKPKPAETKIKPPENVPVPKTRKSEAEAELEKTLKKLRKLTKK